MGPRCCGIALEFKRWDSHCFQSRSICSSSSYRLVRDSSYSSNMMNNTTCRLDRSGSWQSSEKMYKSCDDSSKTLTGRLYWVEETNYLKALKACRNQLPHLNTNCINSKEVEHNGLQDESNYFNNYKNSLDVNIDNRLRTSDHRPINYQIRSPLKQEMRNQFNGSSIGRLESVTHNYGNKHGTKCDHLQKDVNNSIDFRQRLSSVYDKVLVINNILSAKEVVGLLTTVYRDNVHACDTEVAKIDVKKETPVDHGEIISLSIFSGSKVDFGNGKCCIWVDVLDGGGRELLMEFAPFFEDPSIKKVWHNYSFDSHVLENYGIQLSGFHADTMHMARLWDSSRRTEGGYSLEALTSNSKVMDGDESKEKNGVKSSIVGELIGKISMKTIFGKKKLKSDGSEGKVTTIAPVEELQREERKLWICYSALDSMSTLQLFESLRSKLVKMTWDHPLKHAEGENMYDFYDKYWRPFGELLVKMETEGMLVDREYLAEIQKVATLEQQRAASRFRRWAARYCPDAMHMNVGSDIQLRQLFFGGTINSKDPNESLPTARIFRVPNVGNVIEDGKKVTSNFHNITLERLCDGMEATMYTATGWPSVSGEALKTLAGKVSSDYDWLDDAHGFESDVSTDRIRDVDCSANPGEDVDVSSYGTAYKAFGGNKEGREACHAITALCDICSIDSLISNFILPLQVI
ncbi:Dna polymerase i a protein [Thalictrum thalictroides]|uniref:Dna polymerase i a protein n=1 Tax=Thalictrum thalictroides TaxID=46969 RepID=A0A7J6UZP0_THATH|nr:Dna polymerase i a protein [Thalictrum thalictroides]